MVSPVLVLDTNIWLDWLIFDDISTLPLTNAKKNKKLRIVIDEHCRDEFVRVLSYPKLRLTKFEKAKYISEFDEHSINVKIPAKKSLSLLPQCRDKDDQKFLRLAEFARADWLVSRDNDLLRLNTKLSKNCFQIITCLDWGNIYVNQPNLRHPICLLDRFDND